MISPGSLLPALKLNSFAQRWLASIIFWATDLKRFPGGARADIRIHSLLITMISPALLSGCLFVTIDSPLLEANEVVCSSNLQRALPPPHPLCRSYLQTGSDHSFPLPSQKKKKTNPHVGHVERDSPIFFRSLACSGMYYFQSSAPTHMQE